MIEGAPPDHLDSRFVLHGWQMVQPGDELEWYEDVLLDLRHLGGDGGEDGE